MKEPIQPQFMETMNALAQGIDEILNGKAPPAPQQWNKNNGFVLLTFAFGDNGRVNYISNGDRPDMLAMLREYLARAEGRYAEPEGGKPQ